ncbi:MAG: hypothetical protein JJW00_02535 [Sulfurimonas sp.]|nr:hypothetical protein [Sulfurimonas sp.]
MKKMFLVSVVFVMSVLSLNASYFSLREAGFSEDNKYEFTTKDKKKVLMEFDDEEFVFSQDGKKLKLFGDLKHHSLRSIFSFETLLAYSLLGKLNDGTSLQVFEDGNYYFCEVTKKMKKYNSKIFSGKTDVASYEVRVKESIGSNKDGLKMKTFGTFYFKERVLVGFELGTGSKKEMEFMLSRVTSDKLEEFIALSAELKTVATFDDIADETLSLVYKSSKDNKEQRLKVSINTNAKNDKFTEVNIDGMSEVLAHGSKINQKQNIYAGLHTRSLFQTVGKFKDANSNIKFSASPKKSMIKVKYGNGQKKEYTRNKKTPYYNLAGVWMMVTNPKKDALMFFDNTDTPKDFRVSRSEGRVVLEKKSHAFYSFKVEQKLVQEFDIALGEFHFTLEDATTKSILKNRKKLADFQAKYNIVEVK